MGNHNSLRQQFGYRITILALSMLWSGFVIISIISTEILMKKILSLALVLTPLALFSFRAISHELRAYQALALLAPIYFFIAGVIFLWASYFWGIWMAIGAVLLEFGAILHNFRK